MWDLDAALVAANYIAAVQRAGGLAVLVPPDSEHGEDGHQVLSLLDGLMLIGGPDLDPTSYGAELHPEAEERQPARDRIEMALLAAARRRAIPVLGICRGMQLINVQAGGTLHQHVPEMVGHERHRLDVGSLEGNDHEVVLDEGSLAARAAGERRHRVVSHHHQVVDRVGFGLAVTGRDGEDGVPEAVESTNGEWLLGVQWHPEADDASPVIAALVDRARG